MSILDVLLDGVLVARLDDAAGAGMAALQYTDECLAAYAVGAPLLSSRLPVRPEPYPGVATRPWLDGLLPEGDVREVLASRASLDPSDLVGLLRTYGRDCAGAVTVVEPESGSTVPATVKWLTDGELEEAVRELPRAPFGLAVSGKVRVSLAGLQGKLVVVVDAAGRMGLPEGLQPSTHILKPSPLLANGDERYPGIVTAEALSLRFCHRLGLDAAEGAIRNLSTGPALLVTRYDRTNLNGALVRLHQEDLCQALGISSINKYQRASSAQSTPSLAKLVIALRNYQAATLPALREVLARVVANALLTNADAHGKNWSLMLPGTTVRLAPMYDVVPSTQWPDVSTELAMSVGSSVDVSTLRAQDILDEADGWGLAARAAVDVLDRVNADIEEALTKSGDEVVADGGGSRVVEQVTRIVRDQQKRLFA